MVTMFKEMQQVYNTSPANTWDEFAIECLCELHTSQEKNTRLQKVLQHETYCMFFTMRMMRLGPHF